MYKEFLRVRNALVWYFVALALISVFIAIVGIGSGEMRITVGDVPKLPASKIEITPWVELFGFAGFVAAIVSTVLGSTLAQENDHLELAWTKPQSRTRYATSLMAMDALGIIVAQVAAFAFIIGHVALFHAGQQHLVAKPDDALNVLRFLLFPLAWYALIVALSARLRGRASVVQGVIWPVALGLTGIGAAPLPEIWRRIIGGINFINPITYIAENHGFVNVTLAVSMLALIVVASWFAATIQWRRLQA